MDLQGKLKQGVSQLSVDLTGIIIRNTPPEDCSNV